MKCCVGAGESATSEFNTQSVELADQCLREISAEIPELNAGCRTIRTRKKCESHMYSLSWSVLSKGWRLQILKWRKAGFFFSIHPS